MNIGATTVQHRILCSREFLLEILLYYLVNGVYGSGECFHKPSAMLGICTEAMWAMLHKGEWLLEIHILEVEFLTLFMGCWRCEYWDRLSVSAKHVQGVRQVSHLL